MSASISERSDEITKKKIFVVNNLKAVTPEYIEYIESTFNVTIEIEHPKNSRVVDLKGKDLCVKQATSYIYNLASPDQTNKLDVSPLPLCIFNVLEKYFQRCVEVHFEVVLKVDNKRATPQVEIMGKESQVPLANSFIEHLVFAAKSKHVSFILHN